MMLTGEKRRTQRKACANATLFTTSLTRIDWGSSPCIRGRRAATNNLNHGTVFQDQKVILSIESCSAYRSVNTLHFGYKKTNHLMLYTEIIVVSSEIDTKQMIKLWTERRTFEY
jgi:hypothetical protein